MVTIANIIVEYFEKVRDLNITARSSKNVTAELSYRPALNEFLCSIASSYNKDIQGIFEPRTQGKYGRPDWVFTDPKTMGVYGYVEAKGFSPDNNIEISDYENQVKKYLNLGNPVILTDGIEFILFNTDGSTKRMSVFQKPINWEHPRYNIGIIEVFNVFFNKIGSRTISDSILVKEMSIRASYLVEDILELLDITEEEAENEVEAKTVRSLRNLWEIAASKHDKTLQNDKVFAAFIAQILSFGLLHALRCLGTDNLDPGTRYKMLHSFWIDFAYSKFSERVKPFKNLFVALNDELESKFSKIGCWYDNTRRLLSHISLSAGQVSQLNFHEQYEVFLAEFDKKTRESFGAWYTPTIVADFVVNLVKSITATDDELKYLSGNQYKIIDPCCGTGTFIESLLSNFPLTKGSTLTGFEILPVPYALASYRLYQDISKHEGIDIKLILTNTLGDQTFVEPKEDATDLLSKFFTSELHASYEYSTCPITLIIGNPPCSDSSVTNAGAIIENLMDDFRPLIRKSRQNVQQQLSNEWIKFLRWTLDKSIKSRPAIFALILPSTFGKNVSFKYARKFLLDNCSAINIVEFDSDNRNSVQNRNIFNTLQGRLIIIGTLTEVKSKAFVKYVNIERYSLQEKKSFFTNPITSIVWDIIPPNEDYSFVPTESVDLDLYSQFWPLTSDDEDISIFLRHCSGQKLSPTHLLVHASKSQLSRRSRYIADKSKSYKDIKERWYSGQQKPPRESKLTEKVRDQLLISANNISKYSYRPFMSAYVLTDSGIIDALGDTAGGGMRYRPEVQAAYNDSKVKGFAVAPAPAEISTEINKFCSFCWYSPDNDISSRGNGHVFCNYFPDYKTPKRNWDPSTKPNINKQLISLCTVSFNLSKEDSLDSILFYCYAILSSNLFMHRFRGKLHTVAGVYPSIPITLDKDLFIRASQLGRRLAILEREDYSFTKDEFLGKQFVFNIEAGWDLIDFKMHEEENRIIIATSDGKSVVINLPENIIQYSTSGYNIIREWLKYHKYAYFRKSITDDDIKGFESLVNRILLFKKEIIEIDTIVEQILSSKLFTHMVYLSKLMFNL